MFNEEEREVYLSQQTEEEKNFRKDMLRKGKQLQRAESAYDRLTDAEKIFVNYLLNDAEMSYGSAVIKSGMASSNEDAVNIALAFKRNDRVQKAIEEIEDLGGVSPNTIKKGILDLAKKSVDENIRLKSWQTLGKWYGLDVNIIRHELPATPIDVTEVKARISSSLPDVLEQSKDIIAKAKINKQLEPPSEDED